MPLGCATVDVMGGSVGKASGLVVAVLLAACGRSGFIGFAEVQRECRPDPSSGAGCSFLAAPGLHLVDHTAESLGITPEQGEPDGIFVVNPSDDESLLLRVRDSAPGRDTFEPRGEEIRLAPGERRIVELTPRMHSDTTAYFLGGMVALDADRPFTATVYRPFRSFVGNDSELLLPRSALGDTYVVASYAPHPAQFRGAGKPSYFEVIALDEPTEVRWRARQATAGDGASVASVAAGQWSPSVTLRPFESLRVTGAELSPLAPELGDVSGTVVETSTPAIVIGGSRCATVPPSLDGLAGCDPLTEQLLPVALWDQQVVVPHPPLRTSESHYVRIYAGRDEIRVRTRPSVLPVEPTVLEFQGDFLDVVVPHGTSFAVDADGPVSAVGYLSTRDPSDQLGDPAMYQLAPTTRFLSHYTVSTGTQWTSHLLQAVRRQGDAQVTIDDLEVTGWEQFGDFETAIVEVDEGVHVVDSADPFGLTQFGWTNDVHDACKDFPGAGTCQTSYAHPASMDLGR